MATAYTTDDGISVMRSSKTKISVLTPEPLSDAQMDDLFIWVQLMYRSGKSIRRVFAENGLRIEKIDKER